MSASNLLYPNDYNIYSNSLTLQSSENQPVLGPFTIWVNQNNGHLYFGDQDLEAPVGLAGVGFRYSLFSGSTIDIPSGYNINGTFFTNYGDPSADVINYESDSFDRASGVFTVPVTGLWRLTAGAFYESMAVSSVDTNLLVGICPANDATSAFVTSMTFAQASSLQNFSIQCTCELYLTQFEAIQVFTQQASNQHQTLPASRFNFFSGFLISNAPNILGS